MQIEKIAADLGLDIYSQEAVQENGQKIWRITICRKDKSPVRLEDCEAMSNAISPLLDLEPPISGEYNLEVSSPGLERKLETLAQFELSKGEFVLLHMNDKSRVKGRLLAASDGVLSIEDFGEVNIADVKKARTVFEDF